MSHFIQLYDLPVHDLDQELKKIIQQKKLSWENTNQICINTLATHPDDYLIGSGSLELDWNNKQTLEKKRNRGPKTCARVRAVCYQDFV